MANHLHTLFHKSPRNFAFSVRGAAELSDATSAPAAR